MRPIELPRGITQEAERALGDGKHKGVGRVFKGAEPCDLDDGARRGKKLIAWHRPQRGGKKLRLGDNIEVASASDEKVDLAAEVASGGQTAARFARPLGHSTELPAVVGKKREN